MSDINKQMAEFAKELWENYIKPKVGIEFSDTVSYYMATVVSNDGYNRVTIKRPFDDAYQVSCLDDMAGLEAGDTVLVLRFGSGTNNANHIVFGKGNGNMNYTAAAATATATEASVAAGQAAEAAAEAIESAGQAASAAESAQQSALEAQESADTANQAANNALIGLATVEGVVDTVNWFAEHKTASTDTSVVPSKTYYEYNPVAGTLSAVTPEGDENPSEEGWYELSEAISNYVATHIATTNDGLYVVGLSNGWKVLVSSGTGTYTAGIFLIDPSGNIAQATTANGITFDDSKPFYIGDNNASIVFDGNGHISISGIGVSIGSTGSKSINEILTELGASIKTIEYGVGNSATSHSDITSWSSNTPEWQEDKYIWQRTTTNGLTYTYTCIQGAAGEPGAPGVSVSGVTNYYLATSQSSGVTRETTGWTTSIQTMTSTNQYLWNYEVVTGSDGSTLNTTDPIIIGRYGQDGSPGGQGRGITGITEYYLVSNQQTGITPSSSGWTTTVQTTSTTTPYLWNYEVITYTSGSPDTSDARIIGTHGETGESGINSATIFLYQRSASAPSKPSSNLTYNFADKTLTGTLGNWHTAVPTTGTAPLYVTIATAAANTATDTIVPADWSAPSILSQDGGTGVGISSVIELYYSKANTTAPAAPTSTVTTNDPTVQNAWNKALPTYSSSYPHYFTCSEILYTNGTRNWTTPVYAGALTTANQTAASANSTATTANSTANAAKDKIDNLEVGGRNLFIAYDVLPPSKQSINEATSYTYDPETGTYVIKQTAATSGFVQIYSTDAVTDAAQLAGKEVTLSARSITSSRAASNPRVYLYITKTGGGTASTFINKNSLKITYTLPADTAKIGYILRLDQDKGGSTGETLTIVGPKLELGNMATDWTPAPEDTLAEIANIEVGGRNLALGTGASVTLTPVADRTWFTPTGFYAAGTYGTNLIRQATTLYDWTASFDYAITNATVTTELSLSFQQAASSYGNVSNDRITVPVGSSSGHFSTTFNLTSNMIANGNKWLLGRGNTTDTDIRVTISNFKFEQGNRETTWTPAPEDVDSAIAAVEGTATEALMKHGYCSCTAAAATQAKTATLTGFQLEVGSTVHVIFTNANSVAKPSLNVNSTGAKTIIWNNANITAANSPWAAGECVTLVYDGTYWIISGQSNILADNIIAGTIAADRMKANVINAVNNGTGTINADKINVGGSAPQYATGQAPYIRRASTEAVLGQESLEQIVGGSIAWNQIVPKTASGNTSAGITFTNNNDGSWTLTGTGSGSNAYCNVNYVNATTNCFLPNHKYYITPEKSGTATHLSNIGIYTYGLKSPDATPVSAFNPIVLAAESTLPARGWVRLQVTNATNVNIGTVTMKPQVFDLTLMLGAAVADYVYSLESATAGAGVAKLKEWGLFTDTFYAYNVGELKHVSGLVSHDTTGKNLYSQENENGVIYSSGSEANAPNRCRTKGHIPVIANKQYVIKTFTSGIYCIGYAFYDAQKRFISMTVPSSNTNVTNTFTVPINASYVRFNFWKENADFTPDQIGNVQLELGSTATAYEPFVSHSYPLDSTLTLRGVPQLVSNNLCYDGDIYQPDGTVTRRYGAVNLGSLTWNYTDTLMFANMPSDSAPVIRNGYPNAVCARYPTFVGGYSDLKATDKYIYINSNNASASKKVVVRDSAYTDATVFKTAMSGVYLVYPLAAQATETAVPYQQVQAANAAGTESFSTTSLVPVGHYTRYASNLTAAMDSLPVDTTDAARTATNYITNISGSGITVSGNSATAKVQITNKVRVQADSTHFTDVESAGMKVYSGSSSVPVAQFLASSSKIGSDSTHYTEFTSNSLTIAGGTDSPTVTLSTYPVTSAQASTSTGALRISNSARTKTLVNIGASKRTNPDGEFPFVTLSDPDDGTVAATMGITSRNGATVGGSVGVSLHGYNLTAARLACDSTTGGVLELYYPPNSSGGAVQAVGIYSSQLSFYAQSGTSASLTSYYGASKAYIKDGTHQGYVVHGETANHGITIDYLTSGRINFYVDTTSIGYATITSSDERMKTDIKPIDERYKDAIKNIELKNFHFDFDDPTRAGANLLERFGAVAQDVIAAFEDEGLDWEDSEIIETLKDDDGEYYVINYVPFLVARLAADEDRIKELEDKNHKLEEQNKALEERLSVLEDIVLTNLIRDIDET